MRGRLRILVAMGFVAFTWPGFSSRRNQATRRCWITRTAPETTVAGDEEPEKELARHCEQDRGVVTFVKDCARRCFALILFDMDNFEQLWEQVVYPNFQIRSDAVDSWVITFDGSDGCACRLMFADLDEAKSFRHHLDKRHEVELRNRKIECNTAVPQDKALRPME